jgi:hypothetical protein
MALSKILPKFVCRSVRQRHLSRHRKACGAPLSVRSQTAHTEPLKAFFTHLAKAHVILYNPASELELPRIGRRLPRTILTAEEVEQVMAQPDVGNPIGVRDNSSTAPARARPKMPAGRMAIRTFSKRGAIQSTKITRQTALKLGAASTLKLSTSRKPKKLSAPRFGAAKVATASGWNRDRKTGHANCRRPDVKIVVAQCRSQSAIDGLASQ